MPDVDTIPRGYPPYVCEGNLRRCRVCLTPREMSPQDDGSYELVTSVSRGWAEISEDGGWLHFYDGEAQMWVSFPRLAVNWIEWEAPSA